MLTLACYMIPMATCQETLLLPTDEPSMLQTLANPVTKKMSDKRIL